MCQDYQAKVPGTPQNALKNGPKKTKSQKTQNSLKLTFLMKVANYRHSGGGPHWAQKATKILMQIACSSFA